MPRLSKTLEYRRAKFLNDKQNLEQLIRQAWSQSKNRSERTITLTTNESISGLSARNSHTNGFAVHCARYIDGQSVGTIKRTPAPEVEVGEKNPEPDENFLNSDFMALIKGNHVISMNCGRNAASLRIYLYDFFRKAKLPDSSRQFDLIRIGRPDKIAIINAVGVGKVDLKIGISETTASELITRSDDSVWQKSKSAIAEALQAITAKDENLEKIRNAEQGTVTVSINIPKRDLSVAKKGLNSFAEEVVEDEESGNFTIYLRDGSTIRSDEISVKKRITLEAIANSVNVRQTWDEMEKYMSDLEEKGQVKA